MHYKLKKSRGMKRRGRRGRGSRGGSRSGRSGRISRRMRMKGGLGPNDSVNIGLQGTYSFANPAVQPAFKMFTCGTPSQYDAWERLLVACHNRGLPVYILTSGNKVGIIRTLQLMGLDGAFVEVLCTNALLSVNPMNASGQHNFQGQPKYQVIEQIMTERGLNCQGPPIGYLLDDNGFFTARKLTQDNGVPPDVANLVVTALRAAGIVDRFGVVNPQTTIDIVRTVLASSPASQFAETIADIMFYQDRKTGQMKMRQRNSDHAGLCPSIQFVDVLSHQQTPPDYNIPALLANPFYQLNVNQLGLTRIDGDEAQFNFTPIVIIEHMIQLVNAGRVQILFLDFDQTFQIWEGAIPFEHASLLGRFAAAGAAINVA